MLWRLQGRTASLMKVLAQQSRHSNKALLFPRHAQWLTPPNVNVSSLLLLSPSTLPSPCCVGLGHFVPFNFYICLTYLPCKSCYWLSVNLYYCVSALPSCLHVSYSSFSSTVFLHFRGSRGLSSHYCPTGCCTERTDQMLLWWGYSRSKQILACFPVFLWWPLLMGEMCC